MEKGKRKKNRFFIEKVKKFGGKRFYSQRKKEENLSIRRTQSINTGRKKTFNTTNVPRIPKK